MTDSIYSMDLHFRLLTELLVAPSPPTELGKWVRAWDPAWLRREVISYTLFQIIINDLI